MEKIDKSRFAWVGSDPEKREGMARPSVTYWKDAIGRLKKNRVAMVCLCIIILLILSCVIIPWVTPFDSREQHLSCSNKGFFFSCVDERYEGQNLVHVFGTDRLGRDLLVRTFEGGRVSLMIAFAAVAVNLVVGMIYGGISGYFGGLADNIMMRITDILYTIPDILLIILLAMAIKEPLEGLATKPGFGWMQKLGPNMVSIFIIFALLYWVGMARIVRSQVLTLKESEYVTAARALGASCGRIIKKHLLTNCMGTLIVTTTLQIPSSIFTESYLSFLGLGVAAPMPSLGSLATDAVKGMNTYPVLLIAPALMISIMILVFNLFGDGLRDAFDPKLKS